MNYLFIHQNFPGQYRHLAAALKAQGHDVRAIAAPTAPGLSDIPIERYQIRATSQGAVGHRWAVDLQAKCLRAEAVASCLERLVDSGFHPNLIIGHPGWGELLVVKDVLPTVPVLHHLEFVYQLQGADLGFDPEFDRPAWQNTARTRLRRAPQLLAFHDLDFAWAPTRWQASTAPKEFQDRIRVIHEGINTNRIQPRPQAYIELKKAGLRFCYGDKIVSYVSRQLEPYRGFHVFMRMLPRLQALHSDCHVVIVGGDGVSYGSPPANGSSWKQTLLRELEGRLDLSRVHFVGQVPHSILHNIFQVSACHVYLTYPFVLSWSLLEAMSCGAVVVGSATPPVEEVIRHGGNGLLVDFFDHEALASQISTVLMNPAQFLHMRASARKTVVEHYDLNTICLPKQLQLVSDLST